MSSTRGEGIGPYRGYEFQIWASVYLALELMFRLGWTDAFVIEPMGGEDVATTVDAAERPAWIDASGPIPVLIQIKSRTSGHWTAAAFRKVMEGKSEVAKTKGPPRRHRPAAVLASDSRRRFLFLTDAQLEDTLLPLRVKTLTADTEPGAVPEAGVPAELAGRVLALDRLTFETLELRTEHLLRDRLYVPKAVVPEAMKALREEVRARLLADDQTERHWTKSQIVSVLERFGGNPSLASLPPIVRPTNYDQLASHLSVRHALLLDGPPGTGKTLVARDLALAHVPEGYQVVSNAATPAAVAKELTSPDRLLFLIEDPWGKYREEPSADKWATELPRFLAQASDAKKFIVTSRVGIRDQVYPSGLPAAITKIEQRLDESHYPLELRLQILAAETARLDSWQRDMLVGHERHVVTKLTVPLSLQVFGQLLSQIQSGDHYRSLDKLISQSNVEAIGEALANELDAMGRGTVGASVALWAMLMTGWPIDGSAVDDLRGTLSAGSLAWVTDVDPRALVEWLVRTQTATWRDDGRLEMHPTRLEGLERLLLRHSAWADDVLQALLSGLVKRDGGATATTVVKALRNRRLPVPTNVQAAMDKYLVARLADARGRDAGEAFDDVVRLAEGHHPVVTLAKALVPADEPKYSFNVWTPPQLQPEQVTAIAECPAARWAAAVFVSELLPRDQYIYRWKDLEPFLRQFGWDLSAEFLDAAESAITGSSTEVKLLVEAALDTAGEAPPYARIMAAALEAHREAEEWWAAAAEDHRKAMQGEYDAGYSSFIVDEPSDRFAPPRWAFEALARFRRSREGYGWILSDPARQHLVRPWAEAIEHEVPDDEWAALRDACGRADRDVLWRAVKRTAYRGAWPWLLEAVATEPYQSLSECCEALLAVGDTDPPAIADTAASLSPSRRLALAACLERHQHDVADGDRVVTAVQRAILTPDEAAAHALCRRDGGRRSSELLSSGIASILRDVARDPAHPLALEALFALAEAGQDVNSELPAFLESNDAHRRANVMAFAARGPAPLVELVRRAGTDDSDHDCRRAAMWALAPSATERDRHWIIARWEDRSAPVRRDCAEIIGRKRWEEGLPALLTLVRDARDFSQGRGFRGGPEYLVARAAAQALARFSELPRDAISDLLTFVRHPREPSDVAVRYHLVDALSAHSDERLVPIFVRLLSSRARMEGMTREGFPLRYAAAWALVQQFLDPDRRSEDAVEPLAKGALDADARLAAPALIALGLLGPAAHAAVGAAVAKERHAHMAELVWVAATWAGLAPPSCADTEVPADHAIREIAKYASEGGPANDTEWTAWVAAHPAVQQWLERLKSADGMNSALRFVLFQLFEGRADTLLGWDDSRARDLAEAMPVMTLWSMAGGK